MLLLGSPQDAPLRAAFLAMAADPNDVLDHVEAVITETSEAYDASAVPLALADWIGGREVEESPETSAPWLELFDQHDDDGVRAVITTYGSVTDWDADLEAAPDLTALCREPGVGVWIRKPMASGGMRGFLREKLGTFGSGSRNAIGHDGGTITARDHEGDEC
ncbi:hypothetical protein ACFQ9X_17345 [Catenulispora yoronensis]